MKKNKMKKTRSIDVKKCFSCAFLENKSGVTILTKAIENDHQNNNFFLVFCGKNLVEELFRFWCLYEKYFYFFVLLEAMIMMMIEN